MKKNHIIQLLFLTLLSGLLSCNSVPSAPTVITGKFIDENEQPIVGYIVSMDGAKQQGVSATGTFSVTDTTDQNGNYTLSHVAGKSDDYITIGFLGNTPATTIIHQIYVERDGIYKKLSSIFFHRDDYGKTHIRNFKLVKL